MSVIVTEYLELDSRGLNLAQRPCSPICGQSAHRYLNNPLRNFIFDVLGISQELTSNKLLSLMNAHLLLPECDICGYLSMPTPQYFTSTFLTKASAKIGIVKGLNSEDMSQVKFLDCTNNPIFSSINVYLGYDICNFPDYFTLTDKERREKCHNIVKVLSDDHYAENATDSDDDDLNDTSKEILENMLRYWPADMPAFPVDTINRAKITNSHYTRNFYPSHALPYSAKHIEMLRFSKEFTAIEFPSGYGIQLGGGDLLPAKWYWANDIIESVKTQLAPDEKVSIELKFTVQPDWTKLYQTLSALLLKNGKSATEVSQLLNDKITQYKFPPFLPNKQSQKMKELFVTWIGSSDLFAIPSGRSLHYSGLTCLPTSAQLVSFIPYVMDHTACMELWVEKNARTKRLYSFMPSLNDNSSMHLSMPKFLDFGPTSKKCDIHSHSNKPGHISSGSLQKTTIHRSNGWIIRTFNNIFFRLKAYYDNPHDTPIENCALCAMYWTPILNNTNLPKSSTNPKLVCPDHMNNYQVPMSNKVTTEEPDFVQVTSEKSASRDDKFSKSTDSKIPILNEEKFLESTDGKRPALNSHEEQDEKVSASTDKKTPALNSHEGQDEKVSASTEDKINVLKSNKGQEEFLESTENKGFEI